jgi:ubiquinol-cytochrome c reductase cytochrome b subunit
MALLFGGMAIYPFIESWVTGDKTEHHILDRPRNVPTRTALGVAAMTWYATLWIGGGNDLVATQFHVSLNAVTWFLRFAVFIAPIVAFLVTKRICIGLQRSDHERLLHGAETGVIERSPAGRFSERHRTISVGEQYTLTQQKEPVPLNPVPAGDGEDFSARQIRIEQERRRATRFYFLDALRKPTRAELDEAVEHQHHLAAVAHGDGHDVHGNGHDGHGNGHAAEGRELTADGGDEHTEFGTESEHLAP